MQLSVIIIAKNSEDQIKDAISSVNFADEVLVIDNGSTDKTVEVAKKLNAKIFTHESNSFSDLRNYGLSKVSGDWVLYIDTDEVVSRELETNIKDQVLNIKDHSVSAFKIKRKNFYFGFSRKNEWPHVEKLERLFKKDRLKGWHGELHESPIINGGVGELDGYLYHYTHRDFSSMLKKTIEWSKVEAQLRFKAGHPQMAWWRFPRVMFTAFFDSYIKQGGWKVGTVGLMESIYQSFSIFITYARLWELQQKKLKIEG